MTNEELVNQYTYHAPGDKKIIQHANIRGNIYSVAKSVLETVPEGRERSLALTKLEEAMFWANAAIARNN
jgi:hypothetical protein